MRNSARHGADEVVEMEKWLVVAGIWTMCAMCAVLFIRGATRSVAKETVDEHRSPDGVQGAAGD
jgi:hypothetical protein